MWCGFLFVDPWPCPPRRPADRVGSSSAAACWGRHEVREEAGEDAATDTDGKEDAKARSVSLVYSSVRLHCGRFVLSRGLRCLDLACSLPTNRYTAKQSIAHAAALPAASVPSPHTCSAACWPARMVVVPCVYMQCMCSFSKLDFSERFVNLILKCVAAL